MWWLIPAGVIAGKMLYDYITNNEREARERWERKRRKVQKTVEEHRENIEAHIHEARDSYNFKLLTDIHFSSFVVADSAYNLLDDARISLNAIGNILLKTKKDKEQFSAQLNETRNKGERNSIIENIKVLNDFRRSVFDDKDKVKAERDNLLSEVKRLNQQTNELKIFIRERCGKKGIDWYDRLEERRKQKKLSEGK